MLVGANKGSATDLQLQYAEEDARRVGLVLTELGGFTAEDVITLTGTDDEGLLKQLDAVEKKLAAAPADKSLFVFYYSGHADAEKLHLGGASLSVEKLYNRLRDLPATLKIGIIDACRSGSFISAKGGTPSVVRPFEVQVRDELNAEGPDVSGMILLTSSGADELSLETRVLSGSFFTSHLVSGLRGVADTNGDHAVSLEEVYNYAYDQTVIDTLEATSDAQHPAYKKDLKGHGKFYLTRLLSARARLRFPRGDRRCFVTTKDERQLVAEVIMRQQGDTELALAPGGYVLKCREDTKLKVATLQIKADESVDFAQLSFTHEEPASGWVLKGASDELAKVTANKLMIQAEQIRAEDPENLDRGVLLAVQSLNLHRFPEAHQVLLRSLEQLPLPKTCLTHGALVSAAAWSPDGDRLATATSDHVVRVWSLKTLETLSEITHDRDVADLSWRMDGARLTLLHQKRGVVYWDLKPGQRDAPRPQENSLYAVALDPTGVHEALMDQGEVLILRRQADGGEVLKENSMRSTARFSANGRFLAAMSVSGRARVWDMDTRRKKEVALKLAESSAKVSKLAISPDGRLLAVQHEGERAVQVWDVPGARQLSLLSHDGVVTALAFASTTLLLTASEDKVVRLWDATTGRAPLLRMQHEAAIEALSVSPDGQWLATTWSEGNSAVLWNLRTGKETRLRHGGAVKAVAWSPRENRVATASEDGLACIWQVPGEEVARMQGSGQHVGMAFARAGLYLVTATEDEPACLWETATGNKLACMVDGEGANLLAVSPDGTLLATASGTLARVWKVSTGKEISRMQHAGFIHALVFSPDGTALASASRDGSARVWGPLTGKPQQQVTHDGPVKTVAFSADGKRLATGGEDKTARLWEVATGKELLKLEHQAMSCEEPTGVAEEACEQPYMPGTPPAVESVLLSADGRRLATATLDGVVRLWDTESRKELLNEPQGTRIRSMVFTPDGRRLAIANSEPVVSIWEVETGRDLPSVEAQEGISFVEYSADGKYLVTLSDTGMVSIWDPVSRKELSRTLEDASTAPPLLSPDGRFLATVHDAGNGRDLVYSIHLWRTEELIQQACARVQRNLSEEDWEKYVGTTMPYRKTCPEFP